MSQYEDTWRTQVNEKPKLRSYRQFKHEICAEPYIKANLPKWKRVLVSHLRCGVLPLKIEAGRFLGQDISQRICAMCNNNIETEYHFMFHCTSLEKVRNNYVIKLPELTSPMEDHSKMMLMGNMPYIFTNIVSDLWNERTNCLNFLKK